MRQRATRGGNPKSPRRLATLYQKDRAGWLEETSRLIRAGRVDEIDYAHLATYLAAMARWDRREIRMRLMILLAHLLKWRYLPKRRTRRWARTILTQQFELHTALTNSLEQHARAVLPSAYRGAVKMAHAHCGLDPSAVPAQCPFTLAQLVDEEFI